ncbi:hypothetical protein OIDMADRAFT_106866 [Oidiodendron maius Zn]|uniref:Enoyl reductase (ER) domain-containing protein n=1 Tax=Oidiodendron maius (strain Zn) TaxID=913774 RepID=A0A0C3CWB8_OIDMZ|nr:hypothetical protein OIDMADRAFT_106866 [Oidiodendron maius Zn]
MTSHTVYRLVDRNSFRDIKPFEEPIPTINHNEVLVRIRAVALNYRDLIIADGTYPFPSKDQVIPCSDGAGEVVKVGNTVSSVKEGDHVIANFNLAHLYGFQADHSQAQGAGADGVLRQYAVFREEALAIVPKSANLSFPQMASIVCTGVTAWNAFYGNVPLKPGQTVLFQGTGGVSMTGLQIAKAAGAVTIITSSSDNKLKSAKGQYGADYTINYRTTPNWAAEANKITNGRGVDFILDNGGSGTLKQSLDAIAPGGIITIIGFLSPASQADMPDVAMMALAKCCIIRGVLVGPKPFLNELVTFVAQKQVQLPVDKVFGFSTEEIYSAYEYLKQGGHVGKVCINVS